MYVRVSNPAPIRIGVRYSPDVQDCGIAGCGHGTAAQSASCCSGVATCPGSGLHRFKDSEAHDEPERLRECRSERTWEDEIEDRVEPEALGALNLYIWSSVGPVGEPY